MRFNEKKEELPDYTVADMDLEGMPWNSRRLWHIWPGGRRYHKLPRPEAGQNDDKTTEEPWTEDERRLLALGALKAALLIGGVFAAAAFLFLLFCVFVWLR